MSASVVKAALEIALAAVTPVIDTAWENMVYDPIAGTPWQAPRIRFLSPNNAAMSRTFYQERGSMMVELHYPMGKGAGDALSQAEALRTAFARGSSFTNSGTVVRIVKTPQIGNAVEDNHNKEYVLPVIIPFEADIYI